MAELGELSDGLSVGLAHRRPQLWLMDGALMSTALLGGPVQEDCGGARRRAVEGPGCGLWHGSAHHPLVANG